MADVLLAAAPGPGELLRTLRARRPAGTGPSRIAVLDPTPERLERAARIVAHGEPWRGGMDIWFTPGPGLSGDVVFLFPGLDARTGPHPGDVTRWLGLPAQSPAGSGTLGGRTRDTLRLNRVLDAALRRAGIAPQGVAGHSAGEWSALFASGAFPDSAFDEFADHMGASPVPDVVFAAVGLPAPAAARLAEAEPDVVLSHDNAPDQSVLCGQEEAVARCLARVADPSVPRRVLPFRSGFHSPMLAPYLSGFTGVFDRVPLARPAVPVWSATTVAPYPADERESRALLERHLLEPVRFRAVTERLYEAGARLFVQVGCGSLPRFVAATLAGRPHAVISAGSTSRPQLQQLRWAVAALWAEGLSPDLDALGLGPGRGGAAAAGTRRGDPPAAGSGEAVVAAYEAAVGSVSASVDAVYGAWRDRGEPAAGTDGAHRTVGVAGRDRRERI